MTQEKQKILVDRLVTARDTAGYNLKEASKELGFNNYQTLSDIEKGKRSINAHELISMARLYRRDILYFFDQDIRPDPKPLWRKSPDTDVKKQERTFLEHLEHYTELERLLQIKPQIRRLPVNCERTNFDSHGYECAANLAHDIHRILDLGSRPASKLRNILEQTLRYRIFHMQFDKSISGACVVDDALGVGILINSSDKPWRRNYDLAHEFFHVLTWELFSHKEIGEGKKTRPEQYADIFASYLLLPETALLEALREISVGGEIRIIDLIELALEFEVSMEAILWRLVNLGKLKKKDVEAHLADPEVRELDRSLRQEAQDEETPPVFPQRYVSLACRCLMEGRISRGLFAQYLSIERHEVDSYLAGKGFVEEHYEKIGVA
ncbi:MAG: XRE family transcriptional regulator [Desulfomonilia bacterium]|jgi:Zn-dependent peptidase ImmA (M78 family)